MENHHVEDELKRLSTPERAKSSIWYFKTGKGLYGEGDRFIGVTVPDQRKVARRFNNLPMSEVLKLLKQPIHEYRLTALFMLVERFKRANENEKKQIFDRYLKHTKFINNWDLVDSSAPYIVGVYLLDKPKERKILYKLAKSQNLWERRIAILGTSAFIKNKDFDDTFKIAKILLYDKHDLIHKAVGWMLREIGKLDQEAEEKFLQIYYKIMPRTMLRYAIEKFSLEKRQSFLKGKK